MLGIGRGGGGAGVVQPTCVRWQPLQRCRAARAICSTVCEGCIKGRNGRRVSPCQSYLGEKCWKNMIFHTTISRGFEGKNGEYKTEDEKLRGCIKKTRRDGWLRGVWLIISLRSWVLEVFVGSEVQPRCSAEDCIRLNCAVVFYTTVNCGILEKARGTRCEQFQ